MKQVSNFFKKGWNKLAYHLGVYPEDLVAVLSVVALMLLMIFLLALN